MRLIMIGPFPPPTHGMSLANEMLYKGLIKNHVVYRIDTKSGLILEDTPKQGKFNLKKIFYAIWPIIRGSFRIENVSAQDIADLAKWRMCSKIIELNKVSDGKVTEHHKMMIKMALEHYDYLQSEIKQIDDRIDLLLEPYEEERALLEQISGIDHDHIASAGIITEIGVDISVFPTDKYISSGAWLSSANNESAGKRLSSKTNPVIDI